MAPSLSASIDQPVVLHTGDTVRLSALAEGRPFALVFLRHFG